MDLITEVQDTINNSTSFEEKIKILGQILELEELKNTLQKSLSNEILNEPALQSNIREDRTFEISPDSTITYSFGSLIDEEEPVVFEIQPYSPSNFYNHDDEDHLEDPEAEIQSPELDEDDDWEDEYQAEAEYHDNYVSFDQVYREVKEQAYIDGYTFDQPEKEFWGDYEE